MRSQGGVMPIIDLQRRITEAGRIRIGQQVPAGAGKTRPVKLETFRLTSSDKLRIDQAAAMWGGTPQPWDAPAGRQWEVFTEQATLDVIVPPADMAFSQNYELWSAGGCRRRCDGRNEAISQGECLCDPDQRECDIHTRLSVLLRDLPGLGVWRIDTQGYYAAVELSGAVEVIQIAAGRGQLLPARLLLVQRQVKRPGPGGKPQTRNFAVPVLDIAVTPGQLVAPSTVTLQIEGSNGRVDGTASLDRSPITPVPETVKPHPAGTVAEQMAAGQQPAERKPRRGAQQPIPASGIEPRTAEQARADAGETSAIRPYLPEPDDDVPSPAEPPASGSPRRPDAPRTVSPGQLKAIHASLTGLGYNSRTDRDTLLMVVETLAGRELTGPNTRADDATPRTTKNLSWNEASTVIDHLVKVDTKDQLADLVARLSEQG